MRGRGRPGIVLGVGIAVILVGLLLPPPGPVASSGAVTASASPLLPGDLVRSVGTSAAPPAARLSPSPAVVEDGWTNVSAPSTSPPCVSGGLFAWDEADGYGLEFGGLVSCTTAAPSAAQSGTWEYEYGRWRNVSASLSTAPPARYQGGMVWDAADSEIVLFGGRSPTTEMSDTWTWSHGVWTQLSPTQSPPARFQLSMTYDAAAGYVLLYGGAANGGSTLFSDSWEFKAGEWSQLSPSGSVPPARRAASMAYDASSDSVVLFGGYSGSADSDTWSFSDGNWSQLSPAMVPPARWDAGMAFDPTAGGPVLYGGCTALGCATADNDTWLFLNGTWSQIAAGAGTPPELGEPSFGFDPVDHYLMEFAGGGPTYRYNHTYVLAGAPLRWTNISGSVNGPVPCRADAAFAVDPATGDPILFGGRSSCGSGAGTSLGDTWVYSGGVWYNHTANLTSSPSPRFGAGFASDTADGCLILFGGANSTGSVLADTWSWCAGSWQSIASAGPSARAFPGMATDPVGGSAVLFGGESSLATPTLLNDTWSFTLGGGWSEVSAQGPPARQAPVLESEGAGQDVLLFGGLGATGLLSDTWQFDGHAWTAVAGPAPPGRYDAAAYFDPNLGGVVVFSGCASVACSSALGNVWAWVNGTWWNITPLTGPGAGAGARLVDLAASEVGLMFGGSAPLPPHSTWTFRPGVVASATISPAVIDVGISTTLRLSAGGGTRPYTVTWTGLPSGCTQLPPSTLDCTGTTPGNSSITARVVDAGGSSATAGPLALKVNPDPTVNASAAPTGGEPPLNVSVSAVVNGGTAPYTFQWSFGAGGSATGATASYLYAAPGTYHPTVNVTDALGKVATASASVTVASGPTVSITSVTVNASAACGSPWELLHVAATASGGVGPYTYAWTVGTDTFAGSQGSVNVTSPGLVPIEVVATDADHGVARAYTNATGPPTVPACSGYKGTSNGPSVIIPWLWVGVGVLVVAIVVVAALFLLRSRRGRGPPPTPGTVPGGPADLPGPNPPVPADAPTGPGTAPALAEAAPAAAILEGPRDAGETDDPARTSSLILLHLARQPRVMAGDIAPAELTQEGIAQGIGRPQNSFARALKRLEETGAVVSSTRHVRNADRRKRVYELTQLGETLVRDLRSRPRPGPSNADPTTARSPQPR